MADIYDTIADLAREPVSQQRIKELESQLQETRWEALEDAAKVAENQSFPLESAGKEIAAQIRRLIRST